MRIQAGLWAALAALLVTLTPGVATAAPDSNQGRGEERRSDRADAALEAAQDLFAARPRGEATFHARGRRRSADKRTQPPENATAVLRELAQSLPELPRSQRRMARAILARPTDDKTTDWPSVKYDGAPTDHTCSEKAEICLHWVTDEEYGVADPAQSHAPDLTDTDGDGVPTKVEDYQEVLEEVWQRIVVELGYREPRSDLAAANHGPDGSTDIYLAELGRSGMYGYCTMDSPRVQAAYCVLDDDFVGFVAPPEESLRVTAAHEFFHAVQFGYSVSADLWMMEGTAAWIEDEVYDHIDDNVQYLSRSALSVPGASLDRVVPLDQYDPGAYNWLYGSWIWWRFLTEYFGNGRATDPSVVRKVWQRVATGEGSLQAQRNVLRRSGASFGAVFARFGAANRIAPRWYKEGRRYARFVAPATGQFRLTRTRRGTGWKATELDHLSTRHAVVRPGRGLAGRWRLRVDLDLPRRFRGSRATAVVHRRDGRVRWVPVRLNRRGNARLRVPFNRRRIDRVALSLTNASTRMHDCGRQGETSPFSCGGVGVDDNLTYAFRARVVR